MKKLFINKSNLKNKFKYYLLKICPKGFSINIELINNIILKQIQKIKWFSKRFG
jgi:hypothetical protein